MAAFTFGRSARDRRADEALELVLYTRAGCHLCDEMKHALDAAALHAHYRLTERDIDTDPALVALYDHSIPVLTIAGRVAFKGRCTSAEFRRKLERALASSRPA